jgi:oligopeptide transport system substrate-binding protein
MKKLLALMLVMMLVAGMFVGCSSETTDPVDEPTTTTDDQDKEDEPTNEEPVAITGVELMKNVNARKAMAMAFDKSYVTDVILANGSIPADYFVPTNLASGPDGKDFRSYAPDGWNHYNVDAAKEYWAKAKEELGFDTVEVEFLTYDSETSKKISEFIMGQLETNLDGLSMKLNQQPFENKLALADEGKFQIEFAGWGPDYPDPMTFMDMWVTGGGHNTAGYSNPQFDENIERTKTGDLTSDLQARWELLQKTEEILLNDDVVLVPLYQRGGVGLAQPYVKGRIRHTFGGDYSYKYAESQMIDGEMVLRQLDSSDIPSMDTNVATNSVSFEVMANVLEGLYMLGVNDVPEPGVAKSYEVSADGLTYTFHLREDSVWSNGDPVTAQDFVYSWRRLADPNTGSQYAFMVETAGLLNGAAVMAGEMDPSELGVEAIDDYTLVAHLEVPVPYFIKLMTFPNFYPVNQAFVESLEADTFGTSIDTVVYNGPFKLSKWEIGYEYEMVKNDMYWESDVVKLDRINYRIVKDASSGVNLYETGEIDVAGLSGEFVEQFLDHPHFIEWGDTVLFYLVFNIDNH